jgi:hypothetical protein
MPLGSGALAGSNYPVDRLYTAALLDFPAVTQNSLDAVSDRDFMIEVTAALAVDYDAFVPHERRAHYLGHAGISLCGPAGWILHRQQHDAAEKESGRARTGAWERPVVSMAISSD